MRRMLSLHVRPRVRHDFFFRIISVVCPWLGPMGSATRWPSENLRGFSGSRHRPGREFLVSRSVFDAFETGRVADRRSRRRWIIVSDREGAYGREIQTGLILQIRVDVWLGCFLRRLLQIRHWSWRHHYVRNEVRRCLRLGADLEAIRTCSVIKSTTQNLYCTKNNTSLKS